ncbi:MAG: hypothetical protein ACOC0M_00385 [Halomonas sp.]
MLRILFFAAALGIVVFAGLLRFYDSQAAAHGASPAYCEMVAIWKEEGRAGVPEADRYGWPPESVHGASYERDCLGVR